MARKKQKMTKRQRQALARRKKIIGSRAFSEWWSARRRLMPMPSDPFRAYMIDLGLYARPHRKEVWRTRTNRMDYPTIDFPRGRRRPKLPPRKHIKRFKKRPAAVRPTKRKLTPFEKGLVGQVEKFTEKYHLPTVEVIIEPRRSGAVYLGQLFGTPEIVLPEEYVKHAEKIAGVRQQIHATLFHEAGHHAHAAYGGLDKVVGRGLGSVISIPKSEATRKEKERIAWKVAKKHKAKKWTPIMGWRQKTALGTYLGTAVWGGRTRITPPFREII